ncbi:MAG TPA: glycoside hydrolase family 15 protein [Thiobacillus sp.]|nr:MAG: glycosyl hydrolase [Hydrogenophilales bacterium 28-61-11]OYZ58423.1 MAG: glycosyl hydrolase [Hydrogenophilales bacterium 16-61-112]HQT29682.1 glycoside hydrolase family 15 protein [Thiobacillus sp.]HQT70182.1 glycoside hydrolase family 15 protein [Thiobacillus sp.]
MTAPSGFAPGHPGLAPTWTSSDKDLVGTALGSSRLWFTLGHGIVNEVYFPRIDIPQIRDLGFIVADGAGFWIEVKRQADYTLDIPAPGVPLPVIVHRHPRFSLTLRICVDPGRDVLRLEVELSGDPALRPYLLLAPHLGGTGWNNQAWAGRHRGRRMLSAQQGPFALALLGVDAEFRDALTATSAGHVGSSDGWQDFARHGRMSWDWHEAGPGNVALMAALPLRASLALGLSTSPQAAATLALSSLAEPFAAVSEQQAAAWNDWHAARVTRCGAFDLPAALDAQLRTSAQVLKTHSDKTFMGAMVASLSVPWGNQGDERGGYHLVWPRDLAECAQALLALGGEVEARAVLGYLMATQNADGHWLQNQWLGGRPYWSGVQLDETAFPVLLAVSLAEHGALGGMPVADMVRRALAFVLREGPSSPQDRWEEDAGVNPYTLAVCIAALVAGSALLPANERDLPLQVADFWNARLEDWCVARDSALGREHGIAAHYVREAPQEILACPAALKRHLAIKNRAEEPGLDATSQVGVDFLQLVRLGLRRADDPLILDTLKLVDALLKTDTPSGPVWHRYNGDGYGEHADGRPFDGSGRGRGWPLLVGERGHYALARGDDPLPYLHAMHAMASAAGLLPEQVWDAAPLPQRHLQPGRPTGSAMPLAWAHAEFIKLAASHACGQVFDRPAAVWQRYAGKPPAAAAWVWTPRARIGHLAAGRDLLILLPQPAVLHLRFDGGSHGIDRPTQPLGLALHGLKLDAAQLRSCRVLDFTWQGMDGAWLGEDFQLQLAT